MITNEERRQVVAKLRQFKTSDTSSPWDYLEKLDEIIDCDYGCKETGERLADLIEPADRTCELEPPKSGKRRCKRCGAFVSTDAVWDCFGVIPSRFCPNCGARVVE